MSIQVVNQAVWEGSECWLMQRVVGADAAVITQASVSAVSYTVYTGTTVVVASTALTIATVIFDTLQTDAKWTVDATGYNFLQILPRTAIPDGGTVYTVQHKFTAVTTGYIFYGADFILTTRDVKAE